jgi:hypothetical protein
MPPEAHVKLLLLLTIRLRPPRSCGTPHRHADETLKPYYFAPYPAAQIKSRQTVPILFCSDRVRILRRG